MATVEVCWFHPLPYPLPTSPYQPHSWPALWFAPNTVTWPAMSAAPKLLDVDVERIAGIVREGKP